MFRFAMAPQPNSWFSRDVTKILKSKPGGLQKFYLHLRKDYLKIYSCTIPLLDIVHSLENRRVSISEFSSCVTSEDGCGRAVPHLQNDSYGDFQHSKQCKYKEKYLSKFSNVHKWKQTSLLAKVNDRCFFLFPAAMLVPMRPIPISINFCETLCQITRVWNTAQTWGLDRVLIYIPSIACKFLDFIHSMVFDFYFDGVTVKTGNLWSALTLTFWARKGIS